MNEAELELADTVTVGGTDAAAVWELKREMLSPPEGAGPERVTVPTTLLPPVTVAEDSDRLVSVGGPGEPPGVTAISTERLSPFRVVVTLPVVFEL